MFGDSLIQLPLPRPPGFWGAARLLLLRLVSPNTNPPTGRPRSFSRDHDHHNGAGHLTRRRGWGVVIPALFPVPILLILLVLSCGFTSCKNVAPQKGGRGGIPGFVPPGIAHTNLDELVQRIEQPENPKDASTNNRKETEESELPIPAGSTLKFAEAVAGSTNKTETTVITTAPTVWKKKRTLDAAQAIGAAQKDDARSISAKLAGMKPITMIVAGFGLLLILAGAAMWTPWLQPVFPSISCRVIVLVAGVGCVIAAMTLPLLVVGNETLLLVLMAGIALFLAGVAAVWWFVSHHAQRKDESYELGWAEARQEALATIGSPLTGHQSPPNPPSA